MIHTSPLLIGLMMTFTGMIAGCMLGNLKSWIIDAVVGTIVVVIIAWILIQYHVIPV